MHYAELKQAWATLLAPGAPFEIEPKEIRGVTLRTYKNAPPSVREVWLSTQQFAERDYLVYQDERYTYADAHKLTASIANWLLAQGVKPGDRISIAMRNFPEWMLIYWAGVSIGVAVVGMNAWWVPEEMEYGLKDADPKVLFVDQERLDRLMQLSPASRAMKVVGVRLAADVPGVIPWSEVAAQGGEMPDIAVDPDADASIFYTSGTTGFPKGAQLTHRGCVSNLMNIMFAGQATALATGLATGVMPDPEAPPPIPVGLMTTPLFHVTANNCGAYAATAAGGKLVLMYRWDAGEALRLIQQEGVTAMSGVPTMARELINHPDFATTDTSTMMSLGGGGAQIPPDLVGKIDKAVPTARPNTGYGMTETCGIITSLSGDFYVDKPDSAGPAMPTFEAKVVDDDGNALPSGQVGELWVRGAPVIKGYINRPEATAETITDGWLHTGDIARIDEDNFIYIVDRKKDMVLRGGENVYCAEVEAALYRHPAVAEVSVFGVPDERLGEEVGAAIVFRDGQSATAAELREHCTAIMAKHKIPAFMWFSADPLPRNASGKFLKRELRETLKRDEAA